MVAMAELQTAHLGELDAAALTAARALLYDVFEAGRACQEREQQFGSR
jgi:hypothetical protein